MKAAFNAIFTFFTTLANGLNHLATAFSLVCEYFRDAAEVNLEEARLESAANIAKLDASLKLPTP